MSCLRITVTTGVSNFLSASIARSARYSCVKPMVAFKNTIKMITTVSVTSPVKADIAAAAIRINTRTSVNCFKNKRNGDF